METGGRRRAQFQTFFGLRSRLVHRHDHSIVGRVVICSCWFIDFHENVQERRTVQRTPLVEGGEETWGNYIEQNPRFFRPRYVRQDLCAMKYTHDDEMPTSPSIHMGLLLCEKVDTDKRSHRNRPLESELALHDF